MPWDRATPLAIDADEHQTRGVTGLSCHECHGAGHYVMRACPLRGDPGWDYINGRNDREGMACRMTVFINAPANV
jgi:hypothetical protein